LHRKELPGKPGLFASRRKVIFCAWVFLALSRLQGFPHTKTQLELPQIAMIIVTDAAAE
jgi:hypothetical protein